MKARLVTVVLAVHLAYCISADADTYKVLKEASRLDRGDHVVTLPAGWSYRFSNGGLIFSPHTEGFQRAVLARSNLEKWRKERVGEIEEGSVELSVDELLSRFLADQASQFDDEKIAIIESENVHIAGHSAFRLRRQLSAESGLVIESVDYGFVAGEYFYHVRIAAPTDALLEQELPAFVEVLNSIQWVLD